MPQSCAEENFAKRGPKSQKRVRGSSRRLCQEAKSPTGQRSKSSVSTGGACEDGEERAAEVRTHCEQSYADGVEILEMQVEWFREQRSRGESLTSWQKRELVITVDSVVRATGRMMMNKSSSPKDCIVTEVVRETPMSCVYEITHWFIRRLKGLHTAPVAWKVLRLVFLKTPDAKHEKDIRGFRAIALMSVWAKWYCAVLVEMLHEEEEPSQWK